MGKWKKLTIKKTGIGVKSEGERQRSVNLRQRA